MATAVAIAAGFSALAYASHHLAARLSDANAQEELELVEILRARTPFVRSAFSSKTDHEKWLSSRAADILAAGGTKQSLEMATAAPLPTEEDPQTPPMPARPAASLESPTELLSQEPVLKRTRARANRIPCRPHGVTTAPTDTSSSAAPPSAQPIAARRLAFDAQPAPAHGLITTASVAPRATHDAVNIDAGDAGAAGVVRAGTGSGESELPLFPGSRRRVSERVLATQNALAAATASAPPRGATRRAAMDVKAALIQWPNAPQDDRLEPGAHEGATAESEAATAVQSEVVTAAVAQAVTVAVVKAVMTAAADVETAAEAEAVAIAVAEVVTASVARVVTVEAEAVAAAVAQLATAAAAELPSPASSEGTLSERSETAGDSGGSSEASEARTSRRGGRRRSKAKPRVNRVPVGRAGDAAVIDVQRGWLASFEQGFERLDGQRELTAARGRGRDDSQPSADHGRKSGFGRRLSLSVDALRRPSRSSRSSGESLPSESEGPISPFEGLLSGTASISALP